MELTIIIILVLVIAFVFIFRNKSANPDEIEVPDIEVLPTVEVTRTSYEDEEYNDNYWIPVESKKRKVQAQVEIKYKKTNNVVNERVFDVSSFSRGKEGYHIHGYCHKRKRNITLSSLGIIEAIDTESGECIDDITKYLEEKYIDAPEYIHDSLFDEYAWAIYALLYLAATSGSVVKKERDVIISFVKSIPEYATVSDEWMDKTLKDLYRPGKMEIRNWIKEAILNGKDITLIDDAFNVLETMQKKENKEFWTFKKYIDKQVKLKDTPNERRAGKVSNVRFIICLPNTRKAFCSESTL